METFPVIHFVEFVPGLEIAQLGIGQHVPCPSSSPITHSIANKTFLSFIFNGLFSC